MNTHDLSLGTEWHLLEWLCFGYAQPEQQKEMMRVLLTNKLHWGELLEQALRHKVLPLLATYLTCGEFDDLMPSKVLRHLRTALDVNTYRIAVFRGEAIRIAQALQKQSIQFVATKGIIFESLLYGGNNGRYLRDLDLMTPPEDRDRVTAVMSQLGYQPGTFDWHTKQIIPHSRKETVIYNLNPDHLPEFVRLTGDPIIPAITVDIANNLTWTRSPFNIPIEHAFIQTTNHPIAGYRYQLPTFIPVYQFIFTILHLFREAYIEKWKGDQDVNLAKFADVSRLWHLYAPILNDTLVPLLETFAITDAVLWVLEHLDRVQASDIVAQISLNGRVSETWLASAYTPKGMRRWRGTMRERLHHKDRQQLFTEV
jgi:hypothetical protein